MNPNELNIPHVVGELPPDAIDWALAEKLDKEGLLRLKAVDYASRLLCNRQNVPVADIEKLYTNINKFLNG